MRNPVTINPIADLSRLIIGGEFIQQQFSNLANTVGQSAGGSKFPPYNAIRFNEDSYRIEVALAGYKRGDVVILTRDQKLIISSDSEGIVEEIDIDADSPAPSQRPDSTFKYLHKGIAKRDFELTFNIGPYVEVEGATFEDGILTIKLVRNLPENLKPRTIKIA